VGLKYLFQMLQMAQTGKHSGEPRQLECSTTFTGTVEAAECLVLKQFFTTGGLSMAQNSDKVVSMALQNG